MSTLIILAILSTQKYLNDRISFGLTSGLTIRKIESEFLWGLPPPEWWMGWNSKIVVDFKIKEFLRLRTGVSYSYSPFHYKFFSPLKVYPPIWTEITSSNQIYMFPSLILESKNVGIELRYGFLWKEENRYYGQGEEIKETKKISTWTTKIEGILCLKPSFNFKIKKLILTSELDIGFSKFPKNYRNSQLFYHTYFFEFKIFLKYSRK